jgi:ATP-dependent helicase/nuclease subunit A
LPGAIVAIESALELAEAEAPLEPGRPDVVRVMNLHQAKGLEAAVVVLADPSGGGPHAPDLHVERRDSRYEGAVAYARVLDTTGEGWGGGKELARPAGWEAMAAVEERFEAAEHVRLLYVAVTRAKEELVVARWPEKSGESPWRALDPWLDRKATGLDLVAVPPPPRAEAEATTADIDRAMDRAAQMLVAMRKPSYVHRTVTAIAKAPLPFDSARVSGAEDRDALRGYAWGSAVHGALAAAARAPGGEALRATCRDLLVENGRPLDDHGDPLELAELVDLVRGVQASELWTRAMRSERVLSEVSFALPRWRPATATPGREDDRSPQPSRPQLDLFGGRAEGPGEAGEGGVGPPGEDAPTVLEGVIDLAFRESDGWVVADYKTDVGTDPEFADRELAYRRQVEIYAQAWSELTGDTVKERVLFFTAQRRTERW